MLKYDFTRRHETWLPDIYLGRSHRSPNILTRYNSPWRFYLEFVCDVRCHLVTIDNWKPEGGANIMAEYSCNRIEIPALNILFYTRWTFLVNFKFEVFSTMQVHISKRVSPPMPYVLEQPRTPKTKNVIENFACTYYAVFDGGSDSSCNTTKLKPVWK